jgi:hypothetical protein
LFSAALLLAAISAAKSVLAGASCPLLVPDSLPSTRQYLPLRRGTCPPVVASVRSLVKATALRWSLLTRLTIRFQ